MTADPSSAPIDPFARHLAQLLSIVDLAGRLRAGEGGDDGERARVVSDALMLTRRACSAARASLFQLENIDADADEPLWVERIGRDAEGEPVEPVASFQARASAPLLSAIHAGGSVSFGPIEADEPFYALHASVEPQAPLHAAFCPVHVDGEAVGVLEVARTQDAPFDEQALSGLEASARTLAAAVFATRRDRQLKAMLAALLPELLDPRTAPTSLHERVLRWLEQRRMAPAERQAIALASSIAQLARHAPAGLELAQTVLAATRKALVREVGSWSEVSRVSR